MSSNTMDRIVDIHLIEGLRRAAARTRARRQLARFDRLACAFLLLIAAMALTAILWASLG